ncbi:MAG TPA: DUF2779 domain-containing protein [Thermotogota bacterium]|nr:DUF2779 domain-containing protein [Thermotogota bacterium]
MITRKAFQEALECPVKGWKRAHPQQRGKLTMEEEYRRFSAQMVCQKALELFPEAAQVPSGNYSEASRDTQGFLREFSPGTLRGGVFASGDFVATVDLLQKSNGHVRLFEVKASKRKDLGKNEGKGALFDLAYNLWVVDSAGYHVEESALLFLSEHFSPGDPISSLFEVVHGGKYLAHEVQELQNQSDRVRTILSTPRCPDPQLSSTCRDCPWQEHCFPEFRRFTLFHIPHLGSAKIDDLVAECFHSVDEIPRERMEALSLDSWQQKVVDCIRSEQEFHDAPAIVRILESWQPPLAFLDFETIAPTLPLLEGTAPFELLPVVYSLDILPDSRIPEQAQHHEFLANPFQLGESILRLARNLTDQLQQCPTIVAYNMGFEQRVMRSLGSWLAGRGELVLSEELLALHNRFVDLEPLFRQHFYHPAFSGSSSIKKILPVLVPGCDYQGFSVQHGQQASVVFLNHLYKRGMRLLQQGISLPSLQELLEYCNQDSWAMVQIHQRLWKLVDGTPTSRNGVV